MGREEERVYFVVLTTGPRVRVNEISRCRTETQCLQQTNGAIHAAWDDLKLTILCSFGGGGGGGVTS